VRKSGRRTGLGSTASAHPDTIRQRFDRLAAAAGLSRITVHDLRHSYATGALKAGIRPKVISERIGHANVGFFLQTYAHVLGNDDRDAAEQAAAFLIGNVWDSAERDPVAVENVQDHAFGLLVSYDDTLGV
jgi:integrase